MGRFALGFVLSFLPLGAVAQAGPEPQPQAKSCVLQKNVYTCSWELFAPALAAAKTIAVGSQPLNPEAEAQLKKLVTALGRTEATEASADLTFVIFPGDDSGMFFGPDGRDLGTLRVFGRMRDGARGPLLWVETFHGQPDIPFPAAVFELTEQFKARVKGKESAAH
jgi:hypothetical protein